ncbi:MAG: leucine-rich repeat domain-containing protein [Candidatus Brocadiia bacterium]
MNTSGSQEDQAAVPRRVLELNLAHTSWYWVHRQNDPNRLQFWLHQGRLLKGKKKTCVGIDLTDISSSQWLSEASQDERRYVRTAKLGTPEELDQIALMPELEALECSGLQEDQLQWVAELGLPLHFLHLSWCHNIKDLEPLRALSDTLIRLVVSDCDRLVDLDAVGSLKKLQRFEMIDCDAVWEIDPLALLKKLRRVVLRNCDAVRELGPIGELPELISLDLSRSDKIKNLGPLRTNTKLQALDLSECKSVRSIGALRAMRELQSLQLFGCRRCHDLRPIHNLPKLKKLSVPNIIEDGDLLGICINHPQLQQFHVRNCKKIEDLEPLKRMTEVRDLSLAGSPGVSDLSPISELNKLVRLDLAFCPEIEDLTPLEGLGNLEDLYIGGCPKLSRNDITELEKALPDCEIHTT